MLNDTRLSYLVDYFDSNDCFPGIDLSGGVCYFLWDQQHSGDCIVRSIINGKESIIQRPLIEKGNDSFVRFNSSISILEKIKQFQESSFIQLVSSRKPFGIATNEKIDTEKGINGIKIYAYPKNGYIESSKVSANKQSVYKPKVLISYAYGERGNFPYLVIGKPFIGEVNSCCSETYLMIGPFDTTNECENVMSYIRTKFFRFLVLLRKNTQHATSKVYQFVPLQDFSHPWTDEMLYQKYSLTEDEIAFIESMIRPME